MYLLSEQDDRNVLGKIDYQFATREQPGAVDLFEAVLVTNLDPVVPVALAPRIDVVSGAVSLTVCGGGAVEVEDLLLDDVPGLVQM